MIGPGATATTLLEFTEAKNLVKAPHLGIGIGLLTGTAGDCFSCGDASRMSQKQCLETKHTPSSFRLSDLSTSQKRLPYVETIKSALTLVYR